MKVTRSLDRKVRFSLGSRQLPASQHLGSADPSSWDGAAKYKELQHFNFALMDFNLVGDILVGSVASVGSIASSAAATLAQCYLERCDVRRLWL